MNLNIKQYEMVKETTEYLCGRSVYLMDTQETIKQTLKTKHYGSQEKRILQLELKNVYPC